MANPKITEELLNRYLLEECTQKEVEEVECWYNQLLTEKKQPDYHNINFDDIDFYLRNKFQDKIISDYSLEIQSKRKKLNTIYWSSAAAILLIISVSVFLIEFSSNTLNDKYTYIAQNQELNPGNFQATIVYNNKQKKVENTNNTLDFQHQKIVSDVEIITAKGEEFESILPDGTRIRINAGSSLTIPKNYNSFSREVYLQGEAYFEVAKNPQKLFKVNVSDAKIIALGTAFNVKYYPQESPTLKAFLLEGSIQIEHKQEQYKLEPGQLYTHESNSGMNKVQTTELDNQLAWKEGYFIFDHTPLAEILNELARWYNFTYSVDPSYQSKTLSGKIKRNQAFQDIVTILEFSGIDLELKGRHILLKPSM
ncbi:FecR family protein [Sphingobacterium humi]|uniref:DUF4974 domain-containing protein n=1 Tax=Sphingobacterium humi TaxID=1796905 RepID=A0A6N8L6Q1_9SPHI|nr:FecR domain-containing protein [Sphingobacterium humi]MVZ63868.1 DUF4974 domain-containing protein [Sphingobacterium humi]